MRSRIVAAFFALSIVTPTAHAYVRSLNAESGRPEYWHASCVPVTIYTNGFSMMSRHEVAKSIAAAAQAWSPGAVSCSGGGRPTIEIVTAMAAENAPAPRLAYDAHNAVTFILENWKPGYESAVAITSVFARSDGRIVDVDMQINAEWSDWANLDPGFDPYAFNGEFPFDLQNAVTHEFGHLLGFGHTCFSPFSDPAPPINDAGEEVPECGESAPDALKLSVMYAVVDPLRLETNKRHLTDDEVRGICEVYPPNAQPPVCPLDTPNDGCGCSGAGGVGDLAGALAVLAVTLVVRKRRARRAARE
jgi:hypothetical protein